MTPPPPSEMAPFDREPTPQPTIMINEKSGGNLKVRDWIAIVGLTVTLAMGAVGVAAAFFCTKKELLDQVLPLQVAGASREARLVAHVEAQKVYESDVKASLKEISDDVKALSKKMDWMSRGDQLPRRDR